MILGVVGWWGRLGFIHSIPLKARWRLERYGKYEANSVKGDSLPIIDDITRYFQPAMPPPNKTTQKKSLASKAAAITNAKNGVVTARLTAPTGPATTTITRMRHSHSSAAPKVTYDDDDDGIEGGALNV